MNPTHILIKYPSKSQESLFRASDGVMIAGRTGNAVKTGDNVSALETRIFLNETAAAEYLRDYAILDLARMQRTQDIMGAHIIDPSLDFELEERDGESLLVSPNGSQIHPMRN